MLDFIWHLRGSIPFDGLGANEDAFNRMERMLERQRIEGIIRGSDYLGFKGHFGPAGFRSNLKAMALYDSGRFWIDQGLDGRTLRYDLRSLHALLLILLFAFIAFFFGLAGGLWGGVKFAMATFVWVYGMNVLLALVRVPHTIRKALITP